eukprot:1950739-Rhodomonas_salina.1
MEGSSRTCAGVKVLPGTALMYTFETAPVFCRYHTCTSPRASARWVRALRVECVDDVRTRIGLGAWVDRVCAKPLGARGQRKEER